MPEIPREDEDVRVAAFYDDRVARFGVDPRALDWGSHTSQQTRFRVLTQIDDLAGRSILDVGCGLADLFAFLQASEIPASYTGYDISPAALAHARARFPKLDLHLVDLMAERVSSSSFDFVVASGIFHLRPEGAYPYLQAMVEKMYRSCRRGVAFNTLSAKSDEITSGRFVADPAKVLDMCLDITPNVVLRHDYLPHDFTVYLYRLMA
jgi:ubiquinone/menaquinone biosynthesis C-methylase UbiE